MRPLELEIEAEEKEGGGPGNNSEVDSASVGAVVAAAVGHYLQSIVEKRVGQGSNWRDPEFLIGQGSLVLTKSGASDFLVRDSLGTSHPWIWGQSPTLLRSIPGKSHIKLRT